MALDTSKVIVPGHGTVAFAEPGTEPIDPYKFDLNKADTYTGWTISYTSKDTLPSFEKDGGELNSLDAWEQDGIFSSQTPTSFSMSVSKIQISQENMALAFPGGTYDAGTGAYHIGSVGTVTKAVQIIMMDGTGVRSSFYMPNVTLSLGDMPELDAENFFQLSITGNILVGSGGDRIVFYEPRALVVTPTAAPTLGGASPVAATEGQSVTIDGKGFTGTTSVKFGNEAATSYTVVSDTKITAVVPAGAAGSAPITVTNAVGTSQAYAYTRGE